MFTIRSAGQAIITLLPLQQAALSAITIARKPALLVHSGPAQSNH